MTKPTNTMACTNTDKAPKVALITGGAKRIGAAITTALHTNGYTVIIHYHLSQADAITLADTLNSIRPNSAKIIQSSLTMANDKATLMAFKDACLDLFGRIDVLVHNASSFYASDLGGKIDTLYQDWDDLFLTNAKAPLFLSTVFQDELKKNHGTIISLLDIHADAKPFVGYPIYNMAKAAHRMMVQSLALEFAPDIRINGVAPGVNIFPDHDQNPELNSQTQAILTDSVPLKCIGTPEDIADAVVFLANSRYVTGQILAVDGGRGLTLKGG
ncbi:pteridine reductase [Moraxella sp. FZLJ2107]|uniref:pteridine reductase n=1 Tax=unclassified Moraxella TaxID=2685852 RepID=UPI0020C86283|nr:MULTISPECIES: pteridine reductase [unclassified Moraxella]UTO05986.1 pteridine reductase [Moraxella sp. FZLJ2107]UTO22722.1 pteridine reductase [Moraxella sp. FZLJ2109]